MSVHNVACLKDLFIFEYFLAVLTFVLFFFLAYFKSNISEEYPHIHLISTFHVSKGLSGYLYLGNSLIVYVVYPVRFHFSLLHFSIFACFFCLTTRIHLDPIWFHILTLRILSLWISFLTSRIPSSWISFFVLYTLFI